MSASDLPPVLHGLHVFERGWLSSNNVLFSDGEKSLLVDSGYCIHSAQTLQLVEAVLGERTLDCLVNTHLHSDHCGGNAALQARYPQLETRIPPGQSTFIEPWDAVALSYLPTGQLCPPFNFTSVVQPGIDIRFGSRWWQAHAAAGHDPHSLIFFDPVDKILISADALWENGFGIVFPELDGQDAFSSVAATFDLIEKLRPDTVIPGHGPVFSYSTAILARARSRLERFAQNPVKHARHAAKVLLKFKLLEKQQQSSSELLQWAETTPYLMDIRGRFFETEASPAWIESLLQELAKVNAIKMDGTMVLNT